MFLLVNTPNFSWGFFSFHLRTATGSFLRFQNGSGPAPPLAARVAARDRSRIGKPDNAAAPRLKLKNPQLKLGVLLKFVGLLRQLRISFFIAATIAARSIP